MTEKDIQVGDKVEWKYGAGHPQGTAAEIKYHPGEKVQIESRKGNTITRNADEDNPAVRVERQGDGNNQDVVKRMTELTKVGEGKEEEGEENGAGVSEKREREAMEKENKTEKAGEGEQADEPQDEKAIEDREPETKRAKLDETSEVRTKEKKPGPKSTRGRGRGTATTTTTGTRRSGRPKKESRKTSTGANGKDDEAVMSTVPDAEKEKEQGKESQAGQEPSGHTRSQASTHN